MLAASGLSPPQGLAGRSLLAELEDTADDSLQPPPVDSYFEALSAFADHGWAPLRGILRGDLKLIDLPIPELYDLSQDPAEEDNLFTRRRRQAKALQASLPSQGWPPDSAAVPAEEARRLRSLGYAAGGAQSAQTYSIGDDPKTLLHLDRKANLMLDQHLAGHRDAAIDLGREILSERPDMGMVALNLATFLIESGDPLEALETLRAARRAGAKNPPLLRQLGLSLLSLDQAEQARAILEPLVARDASDQEAKNHLALALIALDRLLAAADLLRQALDLDPRNAQTLENLSYLALRQGDLVAAEAHARQATEVQITRASAWNNLAVAQHRQGKSDAAEGSWRQGLEQAPGSPELLYNLAVLYYEQNRFAAAKETFVQYLQVARGPAFASRRQQVKEIMRRLGDH
jgi:Flp pilus assembly protein TadD